MALPVLAFSQGLKPGDTFAPAQPFEVLNDTTPQLRFHRFKGVPLLLDFWFTSCTSCLAGIPKLDSIQKHYGGRLQVVLVTWEKKEKVSRLLTGYKRLRGISLPVVTDDTLLHRLFPHETVPHKVWIDAAGKVIAITGNSALTPGNLAAFVSGRHQGMTLKEEVPAHSGELPKGQLLGMEGAGAKGPVQYAFLGGCRPGLDAKPGNAFRDSARGGMHIRAINNTLAQLYKTAWMKDASFHEARVLVEGNAAECHSGAGDEPYCFEMISSDSAHTKAYDRMRRYLDAALGVRSELQKRCRPVLVLKRQGLQLRLATTGSTPDTYVKDGRRIVENVRFGAIVNNLLNMPGYLPRPVVDETGFSGRADLVLPATFTDLPSFNRALYPYGLCLEETWREMEVIVLQPLR
jgi:thiol-disulfide isomerase/thioredoxin